MKTTAMVVALALTACATASTPPPPPATGGGALIVSDRDGACFTIERAPSAQGGLAIPRQRVCGPAAPLVKSPGMGDPPTPHR